MDIYQHFREDEHAFIDQVFSWKEQVENSFIPKLTDFLDPREQQIITSIIGTNNTDLRLHSYGGLPDSERQRAIIAPWYEEIGKEDFKLSLLASTYQEKFITIKHSDVMGAFLSLGIKRKKLGDIFAEDGTMQIITANEIAPYVVMNLDAVKKTNVTFKEQPISAALHKKLNWEEADKTVSSLRLDVVMKEIYRLSRKEAQSLITKKMVKVNFKTVEDGKFQMQAGDMISVRGSGRSKLLNINGQTKKDKWRITAAKLK